MFKGNPLYCDLEDSSKAKPQAKYALGSLRHAARGELRHSYETRFQILFAILLKFSFTIDFVNFVSGL